jgi:hypothetical protein
MICSSLLFLTSDKTDLGYLLRIRRWRRSFPEFFLRDAEGDEEDAKGHFSA